MAHPPGGGRCYSLAMKIRKHGYKARAATIARWLTTTHCETVENAANGGNRLKTLVTFESESRSYLWTTDRGRSRLIKH